MENIKHTLEQLSLLRSLEKDINLSERQKKTLSFVQDLLSKALAQSKTNEFNIHILGTMKSGKSTFINALLGKDILPNESAACTLVPVVIENGLFEDKIEKILNNGESSWIQGKQIEQNFLNDIRQYRAELDKGADVDIAYYQFQHPLSFLTEEKAGTNIRIIDTPGPNEMKQFADRMSLEQLFLNTLKDSNLIFFVIDIQYYKDEENQKMLERLLHYRPDLKNHVIFILNKMDRLMEQKSITAEGTIEEVQNVLASWGFEENLLFPISSKKALLSRLTEEGLKNNGSFLERVKRFFKKEPSISERYKLDFDEVLPLLQDDVDGKVLSYKPEPKEYYVELFQQSNFEMVDDYFRSHALDQFESLKAILNREMASSIHSLLGEIAQERIRVIDEKVKELPIQDALTKINALNKSIKQIHSFYDASQKEQLLNGINQSQIDNEIKAKNNFSNRFSSSYLPSYSTSWVEYRDDDSWIDPETTEPGYHRKRLEEYFDTVMSEVMQTVRESVRQQIKKNQTIIKSNITKFASDLENKLDEFYKQHDLKLKLPISKSVSVVINDYYDHYVGSAPYLYIESKYRSKERLIFKGLGEKSYVSYRLTGVSDFKEGASSQVNWAFENASAFVMNSLEKAVIEQILPMYKEQLSQIIKIFEENLHEIQTRVKLLEKEKLELSSIKEKLLKVNSGN